MKWRFFAGIATVFFLFGMAGVSQADLVNIGTATYGGSQYNLIYDSDSPLGPITWLDYSNPQAPWTDQVVWATTLGDKLTVNLYSGYTTDLSWLAGWRLPSAGVNPQTGSNQSTSEMGHLYYDELGLESYPDPRDSPVTDADLKASEFNNLIAGESGLDWYWCGTEMDVSETDKAWIFITRQGRQADNVYKTNAGYGLAVRSGQVSAVPVPGAIWLLGSGLVGLAGLHRLRT